jgi:ubiquinone/menaquinone biosynthesis C-methylase UbiE
MTSQTAPDPFEDEARSYFKFLSKLGLTKHLGSMEATRQLVEKCHVAEGQRVLEIGCGVGATTTYLARKIGARVVGTDLLERMVQRTRERAEQEGVAARITLATADARRLPFADARFDAVLMESVNVFFEDKGEAVREYVRVTKPGGYVGLTEMTWLAPPDPEVAAYYQRAVYAKALQADGWIALLEEAGLRQVTGEARPVELPRESRGRIERYGCRGMVRVMVNSLLMLLRDRESREFLRGATGNLPQGLMRHMGYGVYVGRKARA